MSINKEHCIEDINSKYILQVKKKFYNRIINKIIVNCTFTYDVKGQINVKQQ